DPLDPRRGSEGALWAQRCRTRLPAWHGFRRLLCAVWLSAGATRGPLEPRPPALDLCRLMVGDDGVLRSGGERRAVDRRADRRGGGRGGGQSVGLFVAVRLVFSGPTRNRARPLQHRLLSGAGAGLRDRRSCRLLLVRDLRGRWSLWPARVAG